MKADFDARGVPVGYFQLDSWWYFKDAGSGLLAGGLVEWKPQPTMFPDGLAAFQARLGLPLVAHNRWFAKDNAYRARYDFVEGPQMAFPTAGGVFGEFMDDAKAWGIATYEQDWLMSQFLGVPWLRQAPERAEDWMAWMNDAAVARGMTMQICMPGAAHLLDALDRPAVTTVRTSVDHMTERAKEAYWPPFHIVNMLAAAVGVWPFKDNFETTEFGAEQEALISVLSGGMVGVGDDRPATPADAMFLPNARPYLVRTLSRREAGTWVYAAAFDLATEHPERTDEDRLMSAFLYDADPLDGMYFLPAEVTDWHVDLAADLGVEGPAVVYDWRLRTASVVVDGFDMPPIEHYADFAYFVVAPILSNGLALVGETDAFVPVADRRFTSVAIEPDAVVATLAGAPGEVVAVRAFDARGGRLLDPVTTTIGADGTAVARVGR